MRYPYPDAIIQVEDDEDVIVEVIFPDAGTTGSTFINIPGVFKQPIANAGSVCIGKGSELKRHSGIITSNLTNVEPRIDKIRETIKVAGETVVQHENLKSDDLAPSIKVTIIFQ